MGTHHIGGEYGTGETNRRLVRLFCICLGTLFFAYFILAFRILLERGTFGALDLFLISVRLAAERDGASGHLLSALHRAAAGAPDRADGHAVRGRF